MWVIVAFPFIETNMSKNICIKAQVDKYLNFKHSRKGKSKRKR